MESSVEPKPIPALQRHLQLETDFFCYDCGYNLHGQLVTRDERLGFLVCRCPECGKFHPAAMGVSATRPWLARFGVLLIGVWVTAFIIVLSLGGFFTGLCTYAHLETYTQRDWSNVATRNMRIMRPLPDRMRVGIDYYEDWETRWTTFIIIDSLLSVAIGAFVATATWHLSAGRRASFLLFPVLVAFFAYWIWTSDGDISLVETYSLRVIATYAGLSAVAMLIGLFIGRPIARVVVRMLIPPKLRQHVNFLWYCDGKTPPGTAA